MTNFLIKWKLRRKTNRKLEPCWLSFGKIIPLNSAVFCQSHHQASTLAKLDDILKVALCHLVNTLINTDDKAKN